jgi:two-component system sensor histidine kinase KdpD
MDRKPAFLTWLKKIRKPDKSILIDIFVTHGVVAISTIVSLIFTHFGFHEANIIIIFILGVLLVSKMSSGYIYGIYASVISVLCFNFFFTEPYYTFQVYGREYLITFPVMLIVSIITSAMTTQVKRESELSQQREKRNEILYGISRNLLTANNVDQIISMTAVNISNISGGSVIIYLANTAKELSDPYIYSAGESGNTSAILSENERINAETVIQSGQPVESMIFYIPITGRSKPLGVIGIEHGTVPLTNEQKHLFAAVAAQASLSIEREMSNKKQQESRLDVESERIRSNLLRAVSHDLKTPLASLVGSSSTLLVNWDKIDDASKMTLVSDMYDDAQWLANSVDNILSLTKIEDGRIEVKKTSEPAEEVISETVGRVKKYAGNRKIYTDVPPSLPFVRMDAGLMKQLLINLLDNAVKFTSDGAEITVSAYTENTHAVFEVSDNGSGIPAKDLPYIFDRFYTIDKGTTKRKGIGLGLAICKSIAIAHGGKITVMNKDGGGAVFRATIPIGE